MAIETPDRSQLHFICSHCEAHLAINLVSAGATGPCPHCGTVITAPSAEAQLGEQESSLETVRKAMGEELTPDAPPLPAPEPTVPSVPSVSAISAADVYPELINQQEPAGDEISQGNSLTARERAEFWQIVKLIILTLILVAAAAGAFYAFKDEIWLWLDANI